MKPAPHGTYDRFLEGCECVPCASAYKARNAARNSPDERLLAMTTKADGTPADKKFMMDDLRDLKNESEVNRQLIENANKVLTEFYQRRVEIWEEADELGIPRATMARYSGVTAMVVTRALNAET